MIAKPGPMSKWPVLFALAGVSSCVVGPTYRSPVASEPPGWSAGPGTPRSTQAFDAFWAGFEDPVLSRLIQQAIENNYDLKIAGERIRIAQAGVRIAAADGLPRVAIGAAAEDRRQTQTIDWPPSSARYGEYPYYALGLNASWELDLFGETQRRKESAQAAAEAAVERRRGVVLSLTAAVVSDYLSLRASEARRRIALNSLETSRQTLSLARRGLAAGERSRLDVNEAEARVHGVEAAIPPLQARSEELVHALAILLAQAPAEFTSVELVGSREMPVIPALPPSLPSEVIAQRPDIRAAEREYARSSANVGVAVAELYPHFSIPLSIGPASSELHDVLQHASLLWRVGLDGSQTLYAGGRLTAGVDAARANQRAALFAYRQTVLKAFAEVEDALSRRLTEQSRHQALTEQLTFSRQALLEAQQRYRSGQITLLPVLEEQQLLHATEDAQVVSLLTRSLAEIALFKALGGGWQGLEIQEQSARSSSGVRR